MNLYPHQEEALKLTEGYTRCAYYLDMGLGKTFVGAEKMMRLGKRTNLVICQKSKINDWIEHFKTYYPMIKVFNLTKEKEIDEFTGKSVGGRYTIVGVINYEKAWRKNTGSYLTNINDFTLMLDESSLIQNTKAKQTKFVISQMKFDGDRFKPTNVILLSGTPTAGKYENLWSQIHLLGWGISENLYNTQYVNWKTIEVGGCLHKIVDNDNPYKNVPRLKSRLREHGAVFMKTEDVMSLPEQNIIIRTVETTKDYKMFMRDSILDIEGETLVGDTTLTKRLYAKQLCSCYSKPKLEAFRELCESTRDRLIVFYSYNKELKKLIEVAIDLDRPVSIINGQEKDLNMYENEKDSITFVQYQAGAMGLNLQKANKIIYFSLTDRSDLFEQSKKRIHRIGQSKPCFYYILQSKGSVEEVIYKTLEMRKDFTDELFRTYERGAVHE